MLTTVRSSFQAKILIAFSLLSALVSILLSTLYISSEISEKRTYLSTNLKLVSQQLIESIRLPLYAENKIALLQTAENTLRLPGIKGVVILATEGRVLVDLHTADHSAQDAVLTETTQIFSSPLGTSVEQTLSGSTDTERSLIGSLRLERSTTDLSQQIRKLILYAAGSAVLFWLAMSAVFYLILRRFTASFTASFNRLMQGLKRIHEGDYSSRISIDSLDEPAQAAQAANDLAVRLLQRTEENLKLNQILYEREQNLKLLLEALPVGVLWHNSNGRIEYINSFIRDCFGSDDEVSATIDNFFIRILPDPAYREQVTGILRPGNR